MKTYATIGSIVFAVVAAAHGVRMLYGWEVTIAGIVIPVWLSGVALLMAGGLAVMLWREARGPVGK